MRRSLGLALAVAGFALAGPAAAQGDWKRVHLEDETTLDIPAVVGDHYHVPAELARQGDLMFFSVSSGRAGLLDCLLKHTVYGSGPPGPPSRDELIDTLKTDRRIDLCIGRGTNRRKAIDEGGSLKGYPSGRCVVGYTDDGQADPDSPGAGRVLDTLVVAAPGAYYTLACTLRGADQRTAERDWFYDWRSVIQHVQGSLEVP
ncbi:MAG: hypothetical protein ACXU82_16440 [Caulobacteraceae bacterium]